VIIRLIRVFSLLVFSGCSLLSIFNSDPGSVMKQKKEVALNESYGSHLSYWGKQFLSLNKKKTVRLTKSSHLYLQMLFNKILKNNEFIFKNIIKPNFYVIKDQVPYVFSVPSGDFIFSSGLIIKYLKSEGLLATIMSYEMVKCLNVIYQKGLRIPTGYINIDKILKLTAIKVQDRHEIRKLAYLALSRSGFDGLLFLRWLQIRNRNTLDFSHYRQSGEDVIKEEFSFKKFLIDQEISVDRTNTKNSSREYYRFIDQIKG